MSSLAAVAAAMGVVGNPGERTKKLVQWGWDEPDTASLRMHLSEMEQSAYDGCVFSVRYGPAGTSGSFSRSAWGRRRFTEEDLSAAAADLRNLRPRRFTELFLRLNVTPGDVGWFQDNSAILANARLAAALARVGHARGILLDVEQYEGQLFSFAKQPMAAAYGWEGYATQVRRRGEEVMSAFQDGYPGLTVFLTFGHSLPWLQMTTAEPAPSSPARTQGGGAAVDCDFKPCGLRSDLANVSYGLLAPFIDGLLEAARGRTVVVDGFELSYGFRDASEFRRARRLVLTDAPAIVGAREAYRRRLQLGFGLWLDYDWRHQGWDAASALNYFTPRSFRSALCSAFTQTSQYVWLYGERYSVWSPVPSRPLLPETYRRVVDERPCSGS